MSSGNWRTTAIYQRLFRVLVAAALMVTGKLSTAQTIDSSPREFLKTGLGVSVAIGPRLIGVIYVNDEAILYFRGRGEFGSSGLPNFAAIQHEHPNDWVAGEVNFLGKIRRCIVYLPNADLIKWQNNEATLRFIPMRPSPELFEVVVRDAAEVQKVRSFAP
jgi:hypothetical protein